MPIEDYSIQIDDVLDGVYTGDKIDLAGGDFCGVSFDGVGSPDLRESAFDVSGGDGSQFGVEYYGSINWTITGAIHGSDAPNIPGTPERAWAAWSELYRAWVDYPGRTNARDVVPLYFKRPGREAMVVFGRPRRIDPESATSHSGYIAYTALFKQSDPKFYSQTEKSLELLVEVPDNGGLLLNVAQNALLLPLTTSSADINSNVVNNEGDTSTNPVIVFNGPVTNPTAMLFSEDGIIWSVSLLTTLEPSVSVTIDTRLWSRTVLTSDGGSFAGYYRGSKLQDIVIPPGEYDFGYSGLDDSGTSTCEILYRNAWSST